MSSPAPSRLRIATRASPLALWQAQHVAGLLSAASPGIPVEIVHVTTSGDDNRSASLRSFGGIGVFTGEVQRAVQDGRADMAVHSLKDLPTDACPGLALAAVPLREDTADALLLAAAHSGAATVDGLAPSARIGTGSLRRRAQLLFARRDLVFHEARGNVETRIQKLDDGLFDGLILAVAGLKRLGLEGRISCRLEPPVMFAAVGQGALGIECRDDDGGVRDLLGAIEHSETRARVTAERSLLARLKAGCHAPLGAATRIDGTTLTLEAVALGADGRNRQFARASAALGAAVALGEEVADALLAQGAQL